MLTDDYQYESEVEKEEQKEQQTSKKSDKKEPPKKPTKDDLSKFNEWVNRKRQAYTVKYFRNILAFKGLIC